MTMSVPEQLPLDPEAVLDWLAEFGATLAHDLNQPLAAASNYLSAARQIAGAQGAPAPALERAMDKTAAQISRASEAIQRLRSTLTPDEPRLIRTSAHALIRAAAERVRQRIGVDVDVSPGVVEDEALADPGQIEDALASLMEAALGGAPGPLAVLTSAAPDAIRIEIVASPPEGTAPPRLAFGVALARAILAAHDASLDVRPDGRGYAATLPLAGAGEA